MPGKPLHVKWVPNTQDKPGAGPLPGVDVDVGRVVGTRRESVVALSPEGDAAAIRGADGRVRVLQLLSGRVSPYIPAPKGAAMSLAVSGFATVAWKRPRLQRWHTWTAQRRGSLKVPVKPEVLAVAPGTRHAVALRSVADGADAHGKASMGAPRWRVCAHLLTLRGDRAPIETCWGGETSGDAVVVSDLRAVFTDNGDAAWLMATTSWSVGCGGGGEAVHVARLDASAGKIVARWDSDAATPGGAGDSGDPTLDRLQALPGADGALAWQSVDAAAAPGRRTGLVWRFTYSAADHTVRALTLDAPGVVRVQQGSGEWVQAHHHWLVTRSRSGGFVTDAARLPAGLRGGAVTLADDGRHAAVTTPGGTLLWHVARAVPVAWLPMAAAPRLSRSRALWRDASRHLRTATWAQLEGTTPGVAVSDVSPVSWWSRARSAVAATGVLLTP